ncbi:MAG: restriction endonuclease, partial [Candidatus Lindowbacteria bacterium]|nr:restriction endonuclease [Candidatus Lindowbacteria bacterium]
MNLSTIQSEGSLISADLLAEIYSGNAPSQRPADFHLKAKHSLTDEIAACWADARAYWEAFQHGLARTGEKDTGATVTREQWILPLLRSLGFEGISFARSAAQIRGRSYAISHRLGDGEDGLPIHIEGARNELDKRPPTGRPRISPHALVQEYLNLSDHLWGIVTNGCRFRIIRDSARLSRPTYLEFDVEQMLEAERFAEFQLFFRLAHRSRWPRDIESAHECILEQYYQQSIESGNRIRDGLRDNVEKAVIIFGKGFLAHRSNTELRQNIESGDRAPEKYYRELLRLIYRFLFLMVSEERNLAGPDPENDRLRRVYDEHYSITRMREKVERPLSQSDRHWDLWEGVKKTFRLYWRSEEGEKLGIAPLNGDLFDPDTMPALEKACLSNRNFLKGFAQLSLFKEGNVTRRINYAHLDVEELGSVYESLLDFHPVVRPKNGKPEFVLAYGTERKSTGSYYTRPELVHELIKSALAPVIEERLNAAATREQKEKALLSLKVCDMASGSGHFLGRELAKVRTGEEEPTPKEFRLAVRDVIHHCIYGVDLNPLAVDLCKVALWIEGHSRGFPLSFLDHRIRCGNSLIGVDRLDRLTNGIPDDAFKPVTGDIAAVAKKIKAVNKSQRRDWEAGQLQLTLDVGEKLEDDLKILAEEARRLDSLAERSAADVQRKEETYRKIHAGSKYFDDARACNIWTAAFFYPLTDVADPAIPTQQKLLEFIENPRTHGQLAAKAVALAAKHRFFHWPLEFPEIAEAGGFDVALGNPPWDMLQPEEVKFFGVAAPEIAALAGAKRKAAVEKLPEKNPELAQRWLDHQRGIECAGKAIRESGRFVLTAVGKLNTYSLFAELGIATDDTCKDFFGTLNEHKALVSLYDFENREKLFPDVDSRYKFCLLTMSNNKIPETRFSFFLTRTEHLDDDIRRFTLSPEDIALINPNTRTTPVFRTKVDAELTRKIYRRVSVLVNERTGENPWGVTFKQGLFNMTSDSHLFHTEPGEGLAPLYEAKMMWQFDHRWATYDGGDIRNCTDEEKRDSNFTIQPRYWVSQQEVLYRLARPEDEEWFSNLSFDEQQAYLEKKAPRWLLGFRDITNATNERTAIFSILPRVGVGNKIPLFLLSMHDARLIACLSACMDSLALDYAARQKVGGTTLNFFIVKQFPVLSPKDYSHNDIDFIAPRVLELVYTAYDLKPFAEDMGYHGEPFKWDEDRRALLRAELDAYYAHLYSLTRDELRYILDPQDVYGPD